MATNVNYQVPFIPQEGITAQILSAIQLANEQQFARQRLALQQQAQPSEIALRQAQTGQAGAETQRIQATTTGAAAFQAAQTASLNARADLERTQNAYEQETNPIKKAQLSSEAKLKQTEADRAEMTLHFLSGGGVDETVSKISSTLGKLSPDESAQLQAATVAAKQDAIQPDFMKHIQQAVNDISNNRRAVDVARMYAQFRGDIYNKEYLDTNTNQVVQLTANEFLDANKGAPNRFVQYSGTVQNALRANSMVSDIQDGINNMRSVIKDQNFQLSARGRALLQKASQNPENMVAAVTSGFATENLNPQEQRYLMAIATLNERAMSLRSLQSQGAGSEQQREAIVRMLPGIVSADPKMAGAQLDLFQNNLDNVKQGVPRLGNQKPPTGPSAVPPETQAPSGPPPGATMRVPGSDGKMHWSDGKRDLGVIQ